MIFAGEGLFLIELCLLVYCVLSVVTTPEADVQHLPKMVWLVLVVVLPLVGGIAWLVAGRPSGPARSVPYKGNRGVPSPYDRPGRATAASPEDDAAFLQQLRERADAQRAEAQRLRREAAERDDVERREAWRRRHPDEPSSSA